MATPTRIAPRVIERAMVPRRRVMFIPWSKYSSRGGYQDGPTGCGEGAGDARGWLLGADRSAAGGQDAGVSAAAQESGSGDRGLGEVLCGPGVGGAEGGDGEGRRVCDSARRDLLEAHGLLAKGVSASRSVALPAPVVGRIGVVRVDVVQIGRASCRERK